MAIFPTISRNPQEPLEISTEWRTAVSTMERGREFRRALRAKAKRTLNLKFEKLESADTVLLWDFYQSMKGMYGSFYYKFPFTETWNGEYLGKGNASTTVFDMHFHSYTSYTLKVDGTAATSGTYSVSADGNGMYQATFNTPPATNSIITVDFVGNPCLVMRFKEDSTSKEMFSVQLATFGIPLVEIL